MLRPGQGKFKYSILEEIFVGVFEIPSFKLDLILILRISGELIILTNSFTLVVEFRSN